MRYLSVCSGIEAATVAWHPLGWEPVAFAEIDKFPSAVLAHHYPHVPNMGDFTTIKAADVGPIDVLVGGTPCQSFSIAGLRGGLADDRGNLALEFLRLADRTRPKWLVWENVPGVLSSDGGRDFGSILGGLVELRYGFAYRVLDAQFFGVPQRRRRVFVVGHLGDWRRAAAVLFERHSLQGHSAPRRKAGQGVAPSTAYGIDPDCFDRSGEGSGETAGERSGLGVDAERAYSLRAKRPGGVAVARCVTAGHGKRYDGESETFVTHALTQRYDSSEDWCGRGTPIIPIVSSGCEGSRGAGNARAGDPMFTLDTTGAMAVAFAENSRAELRLEGGDGATVGTLNVGGGKPGQGFPAVAFNWQASPGIAPQHVAPTLDVGKDGGASEYAGAAVRRLTPRECERLQGFPDDYTLVPYRGKRAQDGPRYKALGNSMAVPVMSWIGERVTSVQELQVA